MSVAPGTMFEITLLERKKLSRQLSKLRFTIDYTLLNITTSELQIKPDIIILWGEIEIVTEGDNFDGTVVWQSLLKHISRIGLAHVIQWARVSEDEVALVKVNNIVAQLRKLLFSTNAGHTRHIGMERGSLTIGSQTARGEEKGKYFTSQNNQGFDKLILQHIRDVGNENSRLNRGPGFSGHSKINPKQE